MFKHLGAGSFRLKPYRAVFTLEPEDGVTRATLTARYASEEKRKHVEKFGALEEA